MYMIIGVAPKLISTTGEPELLEVALANKEWVLDQLKNLESATVYWQSADHVAFGLYKDGDIKFSNYEPQWPHLQELRVFTPESELHIWKYRKGYHGRWIKGENSKEDASGNCFEQTVKLWGTSAEKQGDQFIKLSEDRGMALAVPVEWVEQFKDGINAFLRERLYLLEDESGCVYITDRRFCEILLTGKNEKLEGNIERGGEE